MKKGLVIVDAWRVEETIEPIINGQIPKWSSEVRENVNRFSEYLDYVCDYERSQGTTIIHCLGLVKSDDVKSTSQVKIKKGDIVTNADTFKGSDVNKKLDIKYFAGFHFGKCIPMHIGKTLNMMSSPNIALNLCMILPPALAASIHKNSWKEEIDKKNHNYFMWSPWGFEMILEKS
jgi:hypothetical protein